MLSNDDTKEKQNVGKLWQKKATASVFFSRLKKNLARQIIDKMKD
ncbi:hypothetical protein AGMMS50222_10230 [Endomicrobiia bacterium]|nr:hypothetical protein AGMMS50222_10230 [Endomicrobiia bacterium]